MLAGFSSSIVLLVSMAILVGMPLGNSLCSWPLTHQPVMLLFWTLLVVFWFITCGHDRNIMFQILVVAGLGMLPILPKHLADRACKLSLLGTIFSSGYSLYSTYGVITCLSEEWVIHIKFTRFFLHDVTLIKFSFVYRNQEHGTCQQFKLGCSLYLQPRILSI